MRSIIAKVAARGEMLARTAHEDRAHAGLGVERAPDIREIAVHRLGRGILAALVCDHELEHAVRGLLEPEAGEPGAQRFEGEGHGVSRLPRPARRGRSPW
jgi:hypothetical protein